MSLSLLQWTATVSSHSGQLRYFSIFTQYSSVVRTRSNKNHKMRHTKKKLWVRGFCPQPLDI